MRSVQRILKISCLVSAILFLWTGCSYKHGKDSEVIDPSAIQPSAELLSEVSYQMVNSVVFQPHCISCHGNSGGVNLESYASALSFLQQIKAAAIDSRQMPKSPAASLTVNELQVLNAWVQVNGRELPANGSSGPTPPTPVLEPTFDSIETNIIHPKCLLCHSPTGNAQRVPLDTLAAMINSPLQIVIPKDAAESDLVLVLQIPPLKLMPPANSGISPVSQADLEIIKTWIQNGAKD